MVKLQEHEYKARDKTVHKMSRDGLREENLHNKEEKRITRRDEDMEVSCDLRQFEGYKIVEHIVLNNDDLQAANTEAQPENVVPVKASAECSKLDGGKLEAVFAKHSWNMIRLAK